MYALRKSGGEFLQGVFSDPVLVKSKTTSSFKLNHEEDENTDRNLDVNDELGVSEIPNEKKEVVDSPKRIFLPNKLKEKKKNGFHWRVRFALFVSVWADFGRARGCGE